MSITESTEVVVIENAGPTALLEGSFALYKHDGGFLVAWRKKGEEQTRHLPIPGFVLQMAAQASGRSVDEMMVELMQFGGAE